MLSQAILIRLKKQPLIIYFKEPINYVIHNSLIIDHEIKFIYKIFKNLGYEKYFIDKSYYKARLAYYKARNTEKINYEKTLVLPPECEKENISKLVPSNVKLVYK